MKKLLTCFVLLALATFTQLFAQQTAAKKCNIIAYYTGDSAEIDKYDVASLSHIIFSFTHIKGSTLTVDKMRDTITIRKLVALKKTYPNLKIILSMGGWGGCEFCSQGFSTEAGRKEFASSSKHILQYFGADGIDLDWEYPTIKGHPGHQYIPEDKDNFTNLLKEMRKAYGKKYEISFAAGGYTDYILHSVDWAALMPYVDRVNLMTYDLVHGYSVVSGHHTPLYSTMQQRESIANAIYMLDSLHVPLNKMVIGSAFYARVFKISDTLQHGLYQPCKFDHGVDRREYDTKLTAANGYVKYWDSTAHAPYMLNAKEGFLVSYDDEKSMAEKTKYVMAHGLDGIMFWELTNDITSNGLLKAITDAKAGK